MSVAEVNEVLVRAITDDQFRAVLLSDPDKALENFDLTTEEIETLKSIQDDSFDFLASELEDRKSRVGIDISVVDALKDISLVRGDKPDLEQLQLQYRKIPWDHKEQNKLSDSDWLEK